jgi:hypothetical protein
MLNLELRKVVKLGSYGVIKLFSDVYALLLVP